MSKKTKAQELQEQLTWSAPHIGKDAPDHKEKAFGSDERRVGK